jgi:hypothetical protein
MPYFENFAEALREISGKLEWANIKELLLFATEKDLDDRFVRDQFYRRNITPCLINFFDKFSNDPPTYKALEALACESREAQELLNQLLSQQISNSMAIV